MERSKAADEAVSAMRAAAATAPLIAALALAACEHDAPEKTARTKTTSAALPARVPLAKVPFAVPGEIPAGPEGDLARRGRVLATRTFEEIPELVGADLHCTSCHLEAATRKNAGPWVGLSSAYPEYRDRAGRDITLEERIDECFERSMSGKPPPHDGPVMRAFVGYIDWLSKDVPRGSEVEGRGFSKIERPPNVDAESGRNSYDARCASCHGRDGLGRRAPDGSYLFPPLWGQRTFNIGAGMARLDTAAAFVRHNMPLGQGESLTLWEAYDIAAYFTERDRPDFAARKDDWPHGGKPRDARY